MSTQADSLKDLMDAYFEGVGKQLNSIEEQTKKTNGRVTMLERLIWPAIGAIAVLTPWALWLTNQALSNEVSPSVKLEIQAAVDSAFRKNTD